MKDNHKSYQKLKYQKMINDDGEEALFELEDMADEFGEDEIECLIPMEIDLIKSRVLRLQISDLCNDVYTVLCKYRALKNHNISRQRRLDLSALEELVKNSSNYLTKDTCIKVLEQRLSRIKTRWYNFRRTSVLRDMVNNILVIYRLPQIEKAGRDLEGEMRSHEELVKKFHQVMGADVDKLRDELARSKQIIIRLEQEIKDLKNLNNQQSNNNQAGYTGLLSKVFK